MTGAIQNAKLRTDTIGYLLRNQFPSSSYAKRWGLVRIIASPNSNPRRKPQEDDATLLNQVKELEEHFKSLSTDELLKKQSVILKEKANQQEANHAFNQPRSHADFVFWAKAASWSYDEMAALSLNRDPRMVKWDSLKPYLQSSPFVKSYENRRILVSRAITSGQLYQSTAPSVFVAWADRMQIDYPPKLKQEIETLGVQIGDWKTLYDGATKVVTTLQATVELQKGSINRLTGHRDELLTSLQEAGTMITQLRQARASNGSIGIIEKTTLLKLVAAMAVMGYAFKPDAARNDATKDIQSDLDKLGLGLDSKTILKWLREACDTIDPKHLP